MTKIQIRSIVRCKRAGRGIFRVIDVRNSGSSEEVRLRNIESNEIVGWFYSAHITLDKKSILENRVTEARTILNKKPRK